MRILHVVSCRGWSSDAYWAARAVVELGRQGHEAMLACRRDAGEQVIEAARGLGVEALETLALGSRGRLGDLADLRRLRAWLPRVDLVHVHRGREHWLAALAMRGAGRRRPLVRTRHIVQAVRPHALNRWLYGRATDRVVTVSSAIRAQLVAGGLAAAERVVAMPGGVDAAAFHPAWRRQPSPGPPTEAPVVGQLSGLRVMKGHLTVIEAAARLAREGRRFRVVFVGRGRLEPRLREAAREAGVGDRVAILGHTPEVASALAAFDIALYPPLESDGMSRALLESLAAGRPVVASRVGIVPEVLVDGETALLVPAGDAAALAAAIGRLLDDPTLRDRLGRSGRALVERTLSGARLAERLVALYRELAGIR
jgi:glycosyltransferase involved in cell wall biosynthesis